MKIELYIACISTAPKAELFGNKYFVKKQFEFTKEDLQSILMDNEDDSWKINGKDDRNHLGPKSYPYGSTITMVYPNNKDTLKFKYTEDWSLVRSALSESYHIENENTKIINEALGYGQTNKMS